MMRRPILLYIMLAICLTCRESASLYLAQNAFYRRMAALGELPSIPPKNGRKGYAA